jgi:hypothetical protein
MRTRNYLCCGKTDFSDRLSSDNPVARMTKTGWRGVAITSPTGGTLETGASIAPEGSINETLFGCLPAS